jgi:hypothetical protein
MADQVATEAITLEAAHALVVSSFERMRRITEGDDPSVVGE